MTEKRSPSVFWWAVVIIATTVLISLFNHMLAH